MSLLSRRGSKVNEAMQNNRFTALIGCIFVPIMVTISTLQDKFPDDTKEGKMLPARFKSSKVMFEQLIDLYGSDWACMYWSCQAEGQNKSVGCE